MQSHPTRSLAGWRDALLRLCPPLRARHRQRLGGLLDTLPDRLGALDNASSEVERAFGEVGGLLREQTLLNDSMVRQGEQLAAAASGPDANAGHQGQSKALALETLRSLETTAARTDGLLESFDRYQAQIRGVKKGEEQLADTLVALQIIERLFRIEAASLPSEMQSVFESLTQEIGQLHGQMRQTLTQQFAALSQTGARIETTKAQLKARAARLAERIAATRDRIQASLAELGLRAAENASRHARLDALARLASDDTAKIVVALQYQDITAQKTQHVKEAVAALNARRKNAASRLAPKLLRQVAQVCALETRHIASIRQDLDQAASSIAAGIRQLFNRLQEIDRDCLSVSELERSVRSAESMTDTLLGSLDEARALAELARDGAEETYQSVASFGGAVTDVTSALRRLALDIKLIALNAQIQAAQVGSGTGLEVLSERTCELSEQTSAFTRHIGEDIAKLLGVLDEVVRECGEIKSAAQLQLENLDSQGGILRPALLQGRAATAAALQAMGKALARSHGNAQALLRSADLGAVSQAPLSELGAALEQIRAAALRGAGAGAAAAGDGDFFLRNRRCTMDSERAVRASPFDGRGTPALAARSPRPPIDNVELF